MISIDDKETLALFSVAHDEEDGNGDKEKQGRGFNVRSAEGREDAAACHPGTRPIARAEAARDKNQAPGNRGAGVGGERACLSPGRDRRKSTCRGTAKARDDRVRPGRGAGLALRYVLLVEWCALVGITEKAMRRKVEEGMWVQGIHYRKSPDGRLWCDVVAMDRWIEGA